MSDDRIWMQTSSGRKFHLDRPHMSEVFLEDIAHSLANQCRFNGHTVDFYSVAQHSVLVAKHLMDLWGDVELAMAGLLHDAAEAYLGDITRPVRRLLACDSLATAEAEIARAVFLRFRLPPSLINDERVTDADRALLWAEKKWVLSSGPEWTATPKPSHDYTKPIYPRDCEIAEEEFYIYFAFLNNGALLP